MTEKTLYENAIPLKYEVFYVNEYGPERRLKLIKLSNILGGNDDFVKLSYNEKTNIIRDIEIGCYDEACKRTLELDQNPTWENDMFTKVYDNVCGNLFQHIDPHSELNTTYLYEKMMNKEIDLHKLAQLNSIEMCPDKSKDIRNQIAARSEIKCSVKAVTSYKCSKCGKSECTLDRRHTRGLDEATNYRATCIHCKHTWNI
jgi:DNA-directed RNA polymerase subunit M/transcription elongation factor TFIIS